MAAWGSSPTVREGSSLPKQALPYGRATANDLLGGHGGATTQSYDLLYFHHHKREVIVKRRAETPLLYPTHHFITNLINW